MSKFFETKTGWINANCVAQVVKHSGPDGDELVATDIHGHDFILDGRPYVIRANNFGTVIPANPGWYALSYAEKLEETDEDTYGKTAIVAWCIGDDMIPIPITAGVGLVQETNEYAILSPDGQVDVPYLETFDNVQAWLKAKSGART